MKPTLIARSALSIGVFAGLLVAGVAHANTVNGSVYRVTTAEANDASVATLTAVEASSAPLLTFSTTTPIDFMSGHSYTIGEFINSDGASTILSGAANASQTVNETLFSITGMVSVTQGETISAGHDDGLTLVIDGITVMDFPGPTSLSNTSVQYTGPSGNYNFQLVYGECCGEPADLVLDLPLTTSVTPEPSSLLLLSTGLLGAGGVLKRKIMMSRT